jgi:hypothetical protein
MNWILFTILSLSYVFALPPLPSSPPWTQDRFVISFWVDPVVPPANFSFEYSRIVSAGFTTLLGGFGAVDPPTVKLQVAACEEVGLACIPCSCESASGPFPSGTCVGVSDTKVFGYQMQDEPQASEFNALATWSASIATRAPGALRFINLLPNYGFTSESMYLDYVSSFITIVKPDVLCFDHYPIFTEPSSSDVSPAGYLRNLAIFRAASLSAGYPLQFWNFLNVMPYGNRSDISEGEIRWQVFSSLAFGSKGILYFCYWTPNGPDFVWGQGLITPRAIPGQPMEYVPGAHYFQVSRINVKLGVYGKVLLNSTSSWVFNATDVGANTAIIPYMSSIASIGGSGSGSSWSLLLGAFSLPASSNSTESAPTYYVLHNQDYASPALFSLSFVEGILPQEIDPSTGEAIPLDDDAPLLPGWQLSLSEGDARLILM